MLSCSHENSPISDSHILQAMARQRGGRAQLTAAQQLDKKQHEAYFQEMRELEHEKKVQRIHQLEVMWEAEDRVEEKRLARLLREEEHERRMEEAIQRVSRIVWRHGTPPHN